MKTVYTLTLSICALVWVLGVYTPFAYALGDEFTVTQTVVGYDLTPPTVPANVIASAVSTTEISLSWDASTDNILVAGYQIFRNGSQIATSTGVTYADTGLAPATSYDYHIVAFDTSYNYSTSSATTTGTTNALPAVEPWVGGNPPVYATPLLLDFKIDVTEYAARISWRTSIPTRSTVNWGKTAEYESASLVEEMKLSNHGTTLTNLEPGVEYQFEIVAEYGERQTVVLKRGSFVTVSLPDTEAPPNVHNLVGRIEGHDAVLAWENPAVPDFAKVRIVRSETGYPRDPFDGTLIFEGDADTYRDLGAFKTDGTRFYAVFAYDTRGNESSGAVVRLEKRGEVVTTGPRTEELISIDVGTTTGIAPLSLTDLIIFQDGARVSFVGGTIPLRGDKPFTVRIPYGRLPEHLKTILVSFTHPQNQQLTFSFLLRVNKEKTFYEATIDALGVEGGYPLSLSVLDYHDRTVATLNGDLAVTGVRTQGSKEGDDSFMGYLAQFFTPTRLWLIALALLLVLVIIGLMHRGRAHHAPSYVPAK